MKLCNKIGYASRDDALANRIVRVKRRGKWKLEYLYPYICPDCGQIHNSHFKSNNRKL